LNYIPDGPAASSVGQLQQWQFVQDLQHSQFQQHLHLVVDTFFPFIHDSNAFLTASFFFGFSFFLEIQLNLI